MFSGITITCFAASYVVTLLLEVSRLFFRARIRMLVLLGFAGAGLLAHTLFLVALARQEVMQGANIAPLSSWFDWCLMAAWVLAAAYLGLVLRRPENALGLFLLPPVLVLIAVAYQVRGVAPFPRDAAHGYWRLVHGGALLMGTVAVSLGCVMGVMYLVQSYRLKHKLPPRPGFKLPSLEWLQRFNRESLLISTCLLFAGLVSGLVINLNQHGDRAVPWTDPVVVSSGVLFLWLTALTLFEYFYKPARQGRKVAYLTLASFLFLGLALGFVLFGEHARSKRQGDAPQSVGWTSPSVLRIWTNERHHPTFHSPDGHSILSGAWR